jgi:hypothetical protein
MPNRTPPPGAPLQQSLTHDRDREQGQPYATEVEDYSHGVAPPPAEQCGQEASSRTRARAKK